MVKNKKALTLLLVLSIVVIGCSIQQPEQPIAPSEIPKEAAASDDAVVGELDQEYLADDEDIDVGDVI